MLVGVLVERGFTVISKLVIFPLILFLIDLHEASGSLGFVVVFVEVGEG